VPFLRPPSARSFQYQFRGITAALSQSSCTWPPALSAVGCRLVKWTASAVEHDGGRPRPRRRIKKHAKAVLKLPLLRASVVGHFSFFFSAIFLRSRPTSHLA
jgi:hypothetical protein